MDGVTVIAATFTAPFRYNSERSSLEWRQNHLACLQTYTRTMSIHESVAPRALLTPQCLWVGSTAQFIVVIHVHVAM